MLGKFLDKPKSFRDPRSFVEIKMQKYDRLKDKNKANFEYCDKRGLFTPQIIVSS
jgi:hypothetical protein